MGRIKFLSLSPHVIPQSAGAQKKWVAEDVDLEALEPDELDVLVRIRSYSFSYVTMDV
jgi:hypothetical protein